jgi:alkaline phosphatase
MPSEVNYAGKSVGRIVRTVFGVRATPAGCEAYVREQETR